MNCLMTIGSTFIRNTWITLRKKEQNDSTLILIINFSNKIRVLNKGITKYSLHSALHYLTEFFYLRKFTKIRLNAQYQFQSYVPQPVMKTPKIFELVYNSLLFRHDLKCQIGTTH